LACCAFSPVVLFVSPRLRVDNKMQIWRFDGILLSTLPYDEL
jgi:hypothetical protein